MLPEAGAQVTLGEGSPLSVALGAVYVTTVPAGLVASVEKDEGMPTSTGLVVSVTVIVNDAWLELLLASVAVQVRVRAEGETAAGRRGTTDRRVGVDAIGCRRRGVGRGSPAGARCFDTERRGHVDERRARRVHDRDRERLAGCVAGEILCRAGHDCATKRELGT